MKWCKFASSNYNILTRNLFNAKHNGFEQKGQNRGNQILRQNKKYTKNKTSNLLKQMSERMNEQTKEKKWNGKHHEKYGKMAVFSINLINTSIAH